MGRALDGLLPGADNTLLVTMRNKHNEVCMGGGAAYLLRAGLLWGSVNDNGHTDDTDRIDGEWLPAVVTDNGDGTYLVSFPLGDAKASWLRNITPSLDQNVTKTKTKETRKEKLQKEDEAERGYDEPSERWARWQVNRQTNKCVIVIKVRGSHVNGSPFPVSIAYHRYYQDCSLFGFH
jgi:hypothetical protein